MHCVDQYSALLRYYYIARVTLLCQAGCMLGSAMYLELLVFNLEVEDPITQDLLDRFLRFLPNGGYFIVVWGCDFLFFTCSRDVANVATATNFRAKLAKTFIRHANVLKLIGISQCR